MNEGAAGSYEAEPEEQRSADRDAMGLDKRRQVVGGTYSPTRARIIATFGAFTAVTVVLVVGFFLLAKELDQPPETNTDEAPWSEPNAPQHPPSQLQ